VDLEKALEQIGLFQRENQEWRWRLPGSAGDFPLFHPGALFWPVALFMVFQMSNAAADFKRGAIMDSALVRAGEWWRLFTAISLHGDIAHCLNNAIFGALLLGLAMGRFGGWLSILAAFVAGAFGNVAGLLLYAEKHRSLGASGMVMAALGLLAVPTLFAHGGKLVHGRVLAQSIAGVTCIVFLIGINPQTDVIAHLGGFVGGVLLSFVLNLIPRKSCRNFSLQMGAAMLFWVLYGWTWWLALPKK
jgi:membrane associated rhomboid family serine protease